MPRAVAINVGANTNTPGVRGPIYPDGSFEYVPIPESAPVSEWIPTYADLDLDTQIPADRLDTQVHLDPEFPEYAYCERYSYGDEHGVKSRPLSALSTGDYVFFYATLSTVEPGRNDELANVDDAADWIAPEWGAYLIGQFELACEPVTGGEYPDLASQSRQRFSNNAHVKRESFDARVLLSGAPDGSALYETATALSRPTAGTEPNRIVTHLSSDSGKGPWWRRPMRFDRAATATLLTLV